MIETKDRHRCGAGPLPASGLPGLTTPHCVHLVIYAPLVNGGASILLVRDLAASASLPCPPLSTEYLEGKKEEELRSSFSLDSAKFLYI
jgi:hypothetical protein